jgi:curli biogenesis system outer membrane secretion channel CsgG
MGRRLRKAIGYVSLTAGSGTITWYDPATINNASPTAITLEYAPNVTWHQRTALGGTLGNITITAITKTGCTVSSSSGSDTSTIRVYAAVNMDDLGAGAF